MTTTALAVAEELRRLLPSRVISRRLELLCVLAQGWHLLERDRVLFDDAIRVDERGPWIVDTRPGPALDGAEFGTVRYVGRRYGLLSERDLITILAGWHQGEEGEVSVESLRDWLATDDEYLRSEAIEQDIRDSGVYSLQALRPQVA